MSRFALAGFIISGDEDYGYAAVPGKNMMRETGVCSGDQ